MQGKAVPAQANQPAAALSLWECLLSPDSLAPAFAERGGPLPKLLLNRCSAPLSAPAPPPLLLYSAAPLAPSATDRRAYFPFICTTLTCLLVYARCTHGDPSSFSL
ncbi:hypothetical protein RRG08_041466 [Elysia crispata]|uniref:Uncharacterized protein n=1 Tax=Elysia crispata TaxID=231223 RepID=A0AAE1CS04_9GAST|nr:hypothetical protein RRG08_041466 [Elysia crispata]